ncbi:hypothetical protein RMS29_011935 [Agrobacterium rosae]|uniref:Uncharacterized protein n=1 Tax=Agrobacterium rosae TaxID=1972867 RepID=A0AAE5VQZ4_9HYPH|nr:hypothetical protein [Agrobacterium rosae]KAA3512993.1 hypothetical protein DXM21_08220 [Agrobacterium rosae]KAA3521520.1 hypothetical protein DXM25_09760 [Agrobacterium rosae]MCM2432607.1 hypothetical protein [Agrobacterium rosae]MDX8301964.1 hypothetical protein [Agrobacterium rosae]MDX8313519.1 hypothetical protein [Agrobacterium rosae]
MTGKTSSSAIIAAIAILLGFGVLFYIMPTITLWLANHYSVWAAAAFDTVAVLAFFLIFWLRARYQRRHR